MNNRLLLEKNYSDIAKEYISTRQSEWENLQIPIFNENDTDYFRNINENDAPDWNTYLTGTTKNPSMMYKFIKIAFQKAFNVCKEYYALGICRIFLDEFKHMDMNSLNNISDELTDIVKHIMKDGNENIFGKKDKNTDGIRYKNFDGMSYNDLKNRFSDDIKKSNAQEFNSTEEVTEFSGKKYNHYIIKSTEDLEPFKELITDPSDNWCIIIENK